MIELNADESMLLLITKHWKHKDYPILRDFKGHFLPHDRMQYIQACCNIRCFGCNKKEYTADVYSIYSSLCEKLLTSRVILRAYENSSKEWRKVTFLQELISELACLMVKDEIKLDYSNVKTKGMEHLVEANP
jgi:hypothetical protein